MLTMPTETVEGSASHTPLLLHWTITFGSILLTTGLGRSKQAAGITKIKIKCEKLLSPAGRFLARLSLYMQSLGLVREQFCGTGSSS